MFGLTFDKLLIIGILAVILLGPDRLPKLASQFAQLVRTLRGFADGAKTRMREEMGDEFDDVDWKKLDPRQYDPRRIIRDALLEELPPTAPRPVDAGGPRPLAAGAPAQGAGRAEVPVTEVRVAEAPRTQRPGAEGPGAEAAAAVPAVPVIPYDSEST